MSHCHLVVKAGLTSDPNHANNKTECLEQTIDANMTDNTITLAIINNTDICVETNYLVFLLYLSGHRRYCYLGQ